jgi:hypothetical protein
MQRSLKRAHSDTSAKPTDKQSASFDRAAQIADFKSFLKLGPNKGTDEADERTCTTIDHTSEIKDLTDDRANSWGQATSSHSGQTLQMPGSQPSVTDARILTKDAPPASAATIPQLTDWSLSMIVGAVEGDASASMETHLGMPLTQDNLSKFQVFLTEQAKTIQTQSAPLTEDRQLGKHEESYLAQLQEIKHTGKWNSRSGVGNKFRAVHAAGTAKGDEWTKLTDKRSQDKFRNEWVALELTEMREKKTVVRSWSRVDKSTFNYRTFGRLVLDFGGWTDKAAVQGASTAALKCLALGEPWAKQHPQSEMVEFAIVELAWEDHFRFMFHTFSCVRAYVFLCTGIRFLM